MLGKLTWAAIPFDQPIIMGTVSVIGLVGFTVVSLITVKGWWPYLWREWITSVDHKRIGVMYVSLALVMLVRGFSDAIMMRTNRRSRPVVRKATCRRSTTTRYSRRMGRS
jgi:cytochrome o ubiquinol oxidase subunit 1